MRGVREIAGEQRRMLDIPVCIMPIPQNSISFEPIHEQRHPIQEGPAGIILAAVQ
jgi:hypothetical protein